MEGRCAHALRMRPSIQKMTSALSAASTALTTRMPVRCPTRSGLRIAIGIPSGEGDVVYLVNLLSGDAVPRGIGVGGSCCVGTRPIVVSYPDWPRMLDSWRSVWDDYAGATTFGARGLS